MTMQPDEFEAAYSKAVETGWDSVKDMARQIWDEAPARLPSQGGEAVAVSLELVENLKYGGMHIRKWDNLSGLGAGNHKLYTHPADQVAEGVVVSRELLVKLLDEGRRAETWAAQDELRQLLAKSEGMKS